LGMEAEKISVAIVDDHPIVLEGMRAMLSQIASVHIVGTSTDAEGMMDLLRREKTDLLITDINMPGVTGIELAAMVSREFPSVRILAMSTFKERSYVAQMIQNGASGYILKSSGKEEIEDAIYSVFEGRIYVGNELNWTRSDQNRISQLPVLSSREKEVLQLIAEGLPNPQIAARLHLSLHTVDSHRKNLLTKFGVNNTAMLIHMASKNNII
jgi:two-component system, NarL family, nitrate/nitrite response regulator NarL